MLTGKHKRPKESLSLVRVSSLYKGENKMVAVGIDVSKGKSMLAAISALHEITKPKEFLHTSAGLRELTQEILAFDKDVKVTMEATGHYHEPVAHALSAAGIFISVVNPLLIYAYGDNSVRRVKTDKKDALKIARYCLENWSKLEPYTPQENIREQLKLFSRQYNTCLKTVHALENNLISLLDKTFPSAANFFNSRKKKNGHQKWVDFVVTFWHLDAVTSLGEKEFNNKYRTWCAENSYKYTREKVVEIYAKSIQGFATLKYCTETELLITSAARQVLAVSATLASIRAQLVRLVILLPEYETVINMYGVGDLTCAHLLAEIGDVKRFRSGRALVAFAGIDPLPVQSGTYEKKSTKISKRGSATLRKVLFQVVLTHLRLSPKDEAVYHFIDRKRAEGKPYFVYMTAAANKFLRIYYAKVSERMKMMQEKRF